MTEQTKPQQRKMRHKEIHDALQYVADNPKGPADSTDTHTWELIGRTLFQIAHSPDVRVRGSLGRATKAQKMILERLVGRRRPGTHPAQVTKEEVTFVDLTAGALESAETEENDELADADATTAGTTGAGAGR